MFNHDLPPAVREQMQDIADAFHALLVDANDTLIRLVGWITRQEKPYWKTTDDPDDEIFRNRNCGFHQGQGLELLLPLTWSNISRALLLDATTQVKRIFSQSHGS